MEGFHIIIARAIEASNKAALARWIADGRVDAGSCGGYMLELRKGGVKGAKAFFAAAVSAGIVGHHEGFVRLPVPEGIRSQNADITEDAFRAFRKVLDDAGLGAFVKRAWSYTD